MAILIDFLGIRGNKRKRQLREMGDTGLIAEYRKNHDAEIISLLMDRYQDVIIARTINYLADETETRDFISDLYLKLGEKLGGDFEIRNFKAWLRRLITNTLIDRSRRGQRYDQYIHTLNEETESIDRKLALEIDSDQLSEALEHLKPLPRLYVIQHFFLGKQNKEIAQEQGLEMNQVRGARNRALKNLKQLLGAEYESYFSN